MLAVRPTGSGDVSDTHIAWRTSKSAADLSSQLIVDDLLFMVSGGGVASCLEAESGRVVWRERLGGDYWASPLYAAGKIYFFSMDGRIAVIEASDKYKLIADNELENGFQASPAVAGNSLYLRTTKDLYCIEAK